MISSFQRVMVTSPHHLGDLIAKVALIRLLKTNFPGCQIVLCARSYVFDLARCIKEIDEIVDFEALFNQNDDQIISDLKKLKIDVLIHLLSVERPIGPKVFEYAKKAGIRYRIGNLYRSRFSLWFKKIESFITHNLRQKRILDQMHEFQWNLTPLKFFKKRATYSLDEIAQLLCSQPRTERFKHRLILPNRFNLILHPGSHGNAKEWPTSKFLKLVQVLKDPQIHLIITGSAEEALRYNQLNVNLSHVTFAMGQLNLKEFIQLIEDASGVVAASTGPIHIASLFNTPTLGLFPKQKEIGAGVWKPIGEKATYIESSNICIACQKRLTEINPKACRCMEGIEVDQVLNVIEGWRIHESVI